MERRWELEGWVGGVGETQEGEAAQRRGVCGIRVAGGRPDESRMSVWGMAVGKKMKVDERGRRDTQEGFRKGCVQGRVGVL